MFFLLEKLNPIFNILNGMNSIGKFEYSCKYK